VRITKMDLVTPLGPCMMGYPYSALLESEFLMEGGSIYFSRGNSKIGRIYSYSVPAYSAILPDGREFRTCPGASRWCRIHCYAQRGRLVLSKCYRLQLLNLLEFLEKGKDWFVSEAVDFLRRKKKKILRLWVSGDFFNKDIIEAWIEIATELPDWQFYTYTRSWRVAELLPLLEELRGLPNFVVYASTDETTGPPPEGWLESGIEFTYTSPSIRCPELVPCEVCGYCIYGRGNVYFRVR